MGNTAIQCTLNSPQPLTLHCEAPARLKRHRFTLKLMLKRLQHPVLCTNKLCEQPSPARASAGTEDLVVEPSRPLGLPSLRPQQSWLATRF